MHIAELDFSPLFDTINDDAMQPWLRKLPGQLHHVLVEKHHGDWQRWQQAVNALPDISPSSIDLNSPAIRIGQSSDVDDTTRSQLHEQLMKLSPWRKGPYEFFGIDVDCEWRSDWKWDRIENHIEPLAGRKVLDVGGGNGYHSWRMRGMGAEWVINLDPSRLFFMQYRAVSKYIGNEQVFMLPLGIDEVPRRLHAFDSVFSMGVLYHRRSPIDHILHLKECLRPGGQLILETLVIDGDAQQLLLPEDRYAQMNNVWFIPSTQMLDRWLARAGFKDIRLVDVSTTTVEEQRATDWMQFQSLTDFLNPMDRRYTVEGYPAPIRAVMTAIKPG